MWDWVNEGISKWEQKHIIEPGNEFILNGIGSALAELGKDVWAWFVEELPYITGYGVIATGAFIMIAPVVTRGGMFKPLGILAGGLILSVCILATN